MLKISGWGTNTRTLTQCCINIKSVVNIEIVIFDISVYLLNFKILYLLSGNKLGGD